MVEDLWIVVIIASHIFSLPRRCTGAILILHVLTAVEVIVVGHQLLLIQRTAQLHSIHIAAVH